MKVNNAPFIRNSTKFTLPEVILPRQTRRYNTSVFKKSKNLTNRGRAGINLSSGILLYLLLINILTIFDINNFYIRTILTFVFLTTIPGLLIFLLLKLKNIITFESLVYIVGLSISCLYVLGLTSNWILPTLGVQKPLSLLPLLVSLDLLLLMLLFIVKKKVHSLQISIKIPKLSLLNKILFTLPIAFPFLSAIGAFSLNNYGNNSATMLMLAGISIYVFLLIYFQKKLNPNIFPYSLFFISLSVLLMTSLRGWNITGHDIQLEYLVFRLTNNNFLWDIADYIDPYNASLSITILPTIFLTFLNIGEIYIYKIVFQIITSLVPIAIFLMFNRYMNKTVSFLSAFSFILFPTFINDFPMLNRQEMATFFFSIILLVLFNNMIKIRKKYFLFFIFSSGMVVSHYSTNYIALVLFFITFLALFTARRLPFSFLKKLSKNHKQHLKLNAILLMTLVTFLWHSQLTGTSGGLVDIIEKTARNMDQSFRQDLRSGSVLYSLFSFQKLDDRKLLEEYVNLSVDEIDERTDKDNHYSKDIYEKYPISLVGYDKLPITDFGNVLQKNKINPYSFNYNLRQISAKMIQVFILVGFVTIVLGRSKFVRRMESDYIFMAFTGLVLLALFTFLPFISIAYGALRFFQQMLVILAVPFVIGVLKALSYIVKKKSIYFTTIILIVLFLSLSGFIPQMTGGFYPQMHLNNSGVYYDSFLTHASEVDSINWLFKNYDSDYDVQSSPSSHSKLLAQKGIFSIKKILPVTIRKDAYIYLDYTNTKKAENIITYKGDLYIYKYPIEFLNKNKDLIYTNGETLIYK